MKVGIIDTMKKRRRSTYTVYARRNWMYRNKVLIIAVGALIVLAIIAAAVLLFLSHKKKQEEALVKYEAMTAASLPTIEFEFAGHEVNLLRGYTDEQDINYVRRSIYVLQDTFDIPVRVNLYGNEISSLSYKVIDNENESLIQESSADDISINNDVLSCTFRIDNLIEDGRDYIVDITLVDANERTVHYYTRIIKDAQTSIAAQIDLALKFNDCLYNANDDEAEAFIMSALATNYWYNDNTDFSDITLYSSMSGITWGTMKMSKYTQPEIEILDVDGEIGHVMMNYIATRKEAGKAEYYFVSEYYRLRVTESYEYVLDYERTVDQLFDPTGEDAIGTKSAKLGVISDKDVNMMCNRAQNLSCFVANNTLWAMETDTKTLKKIFTFSLGISDDRGNYDQHDIRIIKVSDEGDIQFVVFGYMNAGLHEGKVGIGLYIYHADTQEVEEEVFIPAVLPYEILKTAVGDLFYLNSQNNLYVMMGRYLYKIVPDSDVAEMVTDCLIDGTYIIHAEDRIIAWQNEGKVNDATGITVLDMEEERSYQVSADSGCAVKVLGFLNAELVYGQGKMGETYLDPNETELLLMSDMYVINDKLQVQTVVSAGDGFFTGAVDEYNRVTLSKVAKRNSVKEEETTPAEISEDEETDEEIDLTSEYVPSDDYTLFANEIDAYPAMEHYSEFEEVKRTVYFVVFADSTTSAGELKLNQQAKVMFTDERTVDIMNIFEDSGRYYVYAKGRVIHLDESAADAIILAYDQRGLVLSSDGRLFYKRGLIPDSVELSQVSLDLAYRKIEQDKLINVTGISLTEAMYFTGAKIPIVWELDDVSYLFFGYDSGDNITMFDVDTKEKQVLTWEYLNGIFEKTGHSYVVDMEEEE